MNNRLALLIAVVLGAVCAAALHGWKATQEEQLSRAYRTEAILVAESSIKAGTVLSRKAIGKYLTEKQMPVKYIVAGMMTTSDLDRFQNYVLSHNVDSGAPILSQFLEPNLSQNATDDSVVPQGRRAVTIPVDQVGAVAGLLRPGDCVDVVGNFDITMPGASGRPGETRTVTIPLLEAARIIALDSQMRGDRTVSSRIYRTVTLEVTPMDALRLLNGLKQGSIQLLLRNRMEVTPQFQGALPVGVDLKQYELHKLLPYTQFAPQLGTPGPVPAPAPRR